MQDTFVACLGSLFLWSLFTYAARRTAIWYAMRRMSPDDLARIASLGRPAPIDREDLRDERTFVDGWRACEACWRLPTSSDDEHILHHYSFDGSTREKEKCGASAA